MLERFLECEMRTESYKSLVEEKGLHLKMEFKWKLSNGQLVLPLLQRNNCHTAVHIVSFVFNCLKRFFAQWYIPEIRAFYKLLIKWILERAVVARIIAPVSQFLFYFQLKLGIGMWKCRNTPWPGNQTQVKTHQTWKQRFLQAGMCEWVFSKVIKNV